MLFLVLSILFLTLAVLAFQRIRQAKGIITFTYHWGFLIGAFIWVDVLIFSLYGCIASAITYFIGEPKIGLLFFIVFWIVRSAGETLYFFLQQFHQPQHHPHNIDEHFILLRKVFPNLNTQQCYIFMQITWQCILMFSVVSLVWVLMLW